MTQALERAKISFHVFWADGCGRAHGGRQTNRALSYSGQVDQVRAADPARGKSRQSPNGLGLIATASTDVQRALYGSRRKYALDRPF